MGWKYERKLTAKTLRLPRTRTRRSTRNRHQIQRSQSSLHKLVILDLSVVLLVDKTLCLVIPNKRILGHVEGFPVSEDVFSTTLRLFVTPGSRRCQVKESADLAVSDEKSTVKSLFPSFLFKDVAVTCLLSNCEAEVGDIVGRVW